MKVENNSNQYPVNNVVDNSSRHNQIGAATNYVQGKTTVKEAFPKTAEQPVNLSISDEGRNALREMVSKFEAESDDIQVWELGLQNTNEVAWEHYKAMRDMSSLTLKDGNYNVEDVMKSMMEAYETRYNQIVEEHENGDRQVLYELTGESSLTLEEDLAGLDEAFEMCLASLKGYITCKQTNKAFENPNSSWYFHRNSTQTVETKQDDYNYMDKDYIDTAISMMKSAREDFLALFNSINYKKAAATGILSGVFNKNADFMAKTRKLYS